MDVFNYLKSRFIAVIMDYTNIYRKIVEKDPKKTIDLMWLRCYKKHFPWDNPVTLNEKINWLSAMTDTSKWTEYSDKYEVRKYVESIGLCHILTKCYGVWDNVDEINFESLPSSFVIKCTHDCGSTILINNKDNINNYTIKESLQKHLNDIMGYTTGEPHYIRIKPRIMAEEMLTFDKSVSSSIVDYKFWVFNGKTDYCMIVYDREPVEKGGGYTLDLYQLNPWSQCDGLVEKYNKRYNKKMPAPENLNEMIEIAERIGKGFPQVRVDLYNIKGKIFFGEMTFTSQGGRMSYYTPSFQKKLGDMINLVLNRN